MDALDKAMERAGTLKLAQLLLDIVRQFSTPKEDPVYDWQIVPLSRVNATRTDGQYTWEAELPEQINTGNWSAPLKQCALAWGSRIASSRFHDPDAKPTPVAVLVRAVRDKDGQLRAEIGATFLYTQGDERRAASWFLQRGSQLDPIVRALVISFLNNSEQRGASTEVQEGVDLD